MRFVGALLLACATFFLVAGSEIAATGDEKPKKGPPNAEKIIGKWEVTKGEVPAGSLVEFTKDGKLKITLKAEGKDISLEGTYKVEGDILKSAMKVGDKEITDTDTIKTLNKTTLILEDTKGKVVEFKRKK
jgi:uncharacterized protein (TIGR03066 family)